MNVGLLWVPVSVYQMLRGSLVLFVGLFSVIFLHRRLPLEQWLSLFVVMLGIAIVGLSNAISSPAGGGDEAENKEDVAKAVLGAALVLFAQIFTASQFVIEEKIMTRYSLAPLVSVHIMMGFPRRILTLRLLIWLLITESSWPGRNLWTCHYKCGHAHFILPLWSIHHFSSRQ